MKTAVLIDTNYAHANQVVQSIDWKHLGLSLYVEYSDVGWLEKAKYIQTDVLILGKMIYSGTLEMINAISQSERDLCVVVLDTAPKNFPALEKLHVYFCAAEDFTEEYLTQCMAEITASRNAVSRTQSDTGKTNEKSISDEQKLTGIFLGSSDLYLLRIVFEPGAKRITSDSIGRMVHRAFDSLLIDWFQEAQGSYCIILCDTPEVSIIYSVQVIGSMVRMLYDMLKDCGASIYPLLMSEKFKKKTLLATYGQMKELEQACYFCPDKVVLTLAQLHALQKQPDYRTLDCQFQQFRDALLTGSLPYALELLDVILDVSVRPTMQIKVLNYFRAHLSDACSLYAMLWKKDARLPQKLPGFVSLEQERLYIRNWLKQNCSDACAEQPVSSKTVAAVQYIYQNYMQDISQEDLASQLGISTAYFSKLFKRDTGSGFVEFLLGLRIDAAKRRFDTGDTNVQQVSAAVGFNDPKYFSRVFRKQCGVSPAGYLAQRKRNEVQN